MNLESQVTLLELSKRLHELGVNQKSLFCYQPIQNSKPSVWPRQFNLDQFAHPSKDERLAAFTSSELGEMLPDSCSFWKSTNGELTWYCELNDFDGNKNVTIANQMCDTMAKMLIYLIEQGIVKHEATAKISGGDE